MADSNITKKALASALKELMEEVPFEKIGIADICEKCDMNRKSFYYHFKDKYDLVNWIFDMEFFTFTKESVNVMQYDERWEFVTQACSYFYENRNFYRKALRIEGQNSFSDHFREYCLPLLKIRLVYLFGNDEPDDFALNFFADACFCAIERWLLEKECMPPERLVSKLKNLVQTGALTIQREWEKQQNSST